MYPEDHGEINEACIFGCCLVLFGVAVSVTIGLIVVKLVF